MSINAFVYIIFNNLKNNNAKDQYDIACESYCQKLL